MGTIAVCLKIVFITKWVAVLENEVSFATLTLFVFSIWRGGILFLFSSAYFMLSTPVSALIIIQSWVVIIIILT